MATFGYRLRKARQKKGLRQDELAEKVGLTQSAISQFEKGLRVPNRDNLQKIASALCVTEDELIPETQAERDELIKKIKGMNPADLKQVSDFVDFLRRKR